MAKEMNKTANGDQIFYFVGNLPCLDFVNTEIVARGQPVDLLTGFADFVRWLQAATLLTPAQARMVEKRWRDTSEGRGTRSCRGCTLFPNLLVTCLFRSQTPPHGCSNTATCRLCGAAKIRNALSISMTQQRTSAAAGAAWTPAAAAPKRRHTIGGRIHANDGNAHHGLVRKSAVPLLEPGLFYWRHRSTPLRARMSRSSTASDHIRFKRGTATGQPDRAGTLPDDG